MVGLVGTARRKKVVVGVERAEVGKKVVGISALAG